MFVEDIDRNADACTNFFDYANGAWRDGQSDPGVDGALEPALGAGELSKEQLRDDPRRPLEAAATGRRARSTSRSPTSTAPAWTRSAINELGIEADPAAARRDRRDHARRAALQEMIARLHELQIDAPFGVAVVARQPQSAPT